MIEGKTYFSVPMQVRVEDPDTDGFVYGIAYHEVLICACCGGIFSLEELNQDGLAIEILGKGLWVDFSEFIR